MKILLNFGILICLSTSLFADFAFFRDDAPPGFIHLTYPNENPKLEPADVFIPTRNIVEIRIEPGSGDEGTVFEVRIRTNGTTSGASMSCSIAYTLLFKTKAEAMKRASELMKIISGEANKASRTNRP